ncbi:rlmI, partial [Symbiodinium pilosum]
PSPCSDRRPRTGRLPLSSVLPKQCLLPLKMEVEAAQGVPDVEGAASELSSGECSPAPGASKLELA